MACRPAPAVQAVRTQATALWPKRGQLSDGTCASQKHTSQNPGSDHEPDSAGYATAVDLTDDKVNGCDADAWAEDLRLRRDPRVKYVICNRRMFSSYKTSKCAAWEWRPYTGSNPHEKHTHLSILPGAKFDTSPWFTKKEADMPLTKDERDSITAINWIATAALQTAERIEKKLDDLAVEVAAHRDAG